MADEIMDPKRVKEILDLQEEAARKGIPIMVFVDHEHMRRAHKNMEIGAAIQRHLIYAPPVEHRFWLN